MPTPRCEHTRLTKAWDRAQCKRNATTAVAGKHVCEQHARIMLGLPAVYLREYFDANAEAGPISSREADRRMWRDANA